MRICCTAVEVRSGTKRRSLPCTKIGRYGREADKPGPELAAGLALSPASLRCQMARIHTEKRPQPASPGMALFHRPEHCVDNKQNEPARHYENLSEGGSFVIFPIRWNPAERGKSENQRQSKPVHSLHPVNGDM